jgi:SAM-dependent methyltransferase
MGGFYGEDLSTIHAAGLTVPTAGLQALLRREGVPSGRVLDLGCGPGRWLAAIRRGGWEAEGIDASAAMVRLARRAAPGARVRRGSVHGMGFPACDAATALGEVLQYLPGGRGPAPDLGRTFRRLAAAIRPGGLLLFDLLLDGSRLPTETRAWREGPGWAVMAATRRVPGRRQLEREIHTFRRAGGRWRRSLEVHFLLLPRREEVERVLREAGFTVRVRRTLGGAPLLPHRLVFLARRRREA